MDGIEVIPDMNDEEWYREIIPLKLDRISLLNIVANLELALRHPDIPPTTRKVTREIGKSLALRLIKDGIIIPIETWGSWITTFGIKPEEFDLSVYRTCFPGVN